MNPIDLFKGKLNCLHNGFMLTTMTVSLQTSRSLYTNIKESEGDMSQIILWSNLLSETGHSIELFIISSVEFFATLKTTMLNQNNDLILYSELLDIKKFKNLMEKFDYFEKEIKKIIDINVYGILSNAGVNFEDHKNKQLEIENIEDLQKELMSVFQRVSKGIVFVFLNK